MSSKKIIPFSILLVALLASVVYFFLLPKSITVPYKTFYKEAGEGLICKANIGEGEIVFYYKDKPNIKYSTDNPRSLTLKEYLLLNDIEVKDEVSGTDVFGIVLDSIFYILFFGMAGFGFVKFIKPQSFKVVHKTRVTFNDIIGMDGLKKDLMQIVDILKHPKEYERRGIRLPKGILLEGAPGNGKTLFAKALAQEAHVNFIPAKATDFESMFMAIGPLKVKLLFQKARAASPCIVFIDEFDGIGTVRNYSGSAIETENTRIVTALLNELDGFKSNQGIVVIAATNSRAALDPALIRPGRFDAKYTVPYPGEKEIASLIDLYASSKIDYTKCSKEKLITMFKGSSASQIESVLNRASLIALQNSRKLFDMQDIILALKEI